MADVVVNIRGNADQLRRELEDIETNPPQPSGRQPDNTRPAPAAPDSRLIDEVREEIERQRREGANARTSVENAGQNQRERIDNDVTQRYDARRADMQRRAGNEYESIDAEIERMRQQSYSNAGSGADDPIRRKLIDQQAEAERERRYQEAGERYDSEEEQLNVEEKGERSQAEQELTKVLEELVAQMKRQGEGGGTSDSFLGRLRDQRKQLIAERESAMDEAGVADAQSRLNLVDEQLRRTLAGGAGQQGKPYYDSLLQGTQGIQSLMGGIAGGNIGQSISGGGAAIAGLSGMGLKAALRFMGWVGVAAAGAQGLSSTSDTSEGLSDLARYRSSAGGYTGSDARHYLGAGLPGAGTGAGTSYTGYGMSIEDFSDQASRRIRSRRMTDDWYNETMGQIGLERSLGLDQDAMVKGGQYDRYGQNVTDAVSRLVTVLSSIEGSGVSFDDFSRVQEKFDVQQQVMQGYLSRTDRPDYNLANRTVSAFSSVPGITQDSRMGSDIEQFQNMIQNPMNERMKALVYGTVADLFPESGGRMDLIDRALQNPENEGQIMQSVVQRIVSQFGGTDTQMGYFAFKSLLPNIAPDRRDAYIEAFSKGESGGLLSGGIDFDSGNIKEVAGRNRNRWEQQTLGYFTDWTKGINEMKDDLKNIAGKVTGTTRAPKPNSSLPASK